jgi:hypothetical protein
MDYSCKAEEMYEPSALFSKAKRYVIKNFDNWAILSAKYGFLKPNEKIDTYDLTLNNMSAKDVKAWSKEVAEHLYGYDKVYFFAGKQYRKYLIPLLEAKGIECIIPLQGMGIGQQLQFYNNQ